VGKDRSGLYEPAVQEYSQRLSHYCRFSTVELPAGRAKEDEAKALLAKVASSDWLIALDERGTLLDSVGFSRYVGKAQLQARDLLLVLGGDEGLHPSVTERAHLVLSLSRMTLPHRLARVVIAEQLYRAFTLLRGEPYHK